MFGILHLKRLVVACAIAAGAILSLSSGPAQAQTLDTITCTGSTLATYSPPITNQVTAVTYSSDFNFGPCISTVPGITSGGFDLSAQIERSCLYLLENVSLSLVIDWNNGQSSTAQVSYVANMAGAVYTVTALGTVTDGVFLGRSFTLQMTAPSLNITLCTLGLGDVSAINFTNVLEIL